MQVPAYAIAFTKESGPIDKKQYIRYDNTVHEHGIIP